MSRVLLLGGIALGLAMVSDPAAARTQLQMQSDVQSSALLGIGRAGLTLALNIIGAAHQTVQSWSDGVTEAVSLVALGLGLLGMGQTLSWRRRLQRKDALAIDTSAGRAADEVLTPRDSNVTALAQRAAR